MQSLATSEPKRLRVFLPPSCGCSSWFDLPANFTASEEPLPWPCGNGDGVNNHNYNNNNHNHSNQNTTQASGRRPRQEAGASAAGLLPVPPSTGAAAGAMSCVSHTNTSNGETAAVTMTTTTGGGGRRRAALMPEDYPFYCDACQKGFRDGAAYRLHADSHMYCPAPGCRFTCRADKAYKMEEHMELLHNRPDAPNLADSAAYLAQRRRRFPTAERVQAKVEELYYQAAQGAVLPEERRRWMRRHGIVIGKRPRSAASYIARGSLPAAAGAGAHGDTAGGADDGGARAARPRREGAGEEEEEGRREGDSASESTRGGTSSGDDSEGDDADVDMRSFSSGSSGSRHSAAEEGEEKESAPRADDDATADARPAPQFTSAPDASAAPTPASQKRHMAALRARFAQAARAGEEGGAITAAAAAAPAPALKVHTPAGACEEDGKGGGATANTGEPEERDGGDEGPPAPVSARGAPAEAQREVTRVLAPVAAARLAGRARGGGRAAAGAARVVPKTLYERLTEEERVDELGVLLQAFRFFVRERFFEGWPH